VVCFSVGRFEETSWLGKPSGLGETKPLVDQIPQTSASQIPAKIVAEKIGHRINSAGRLAGDVWRDQKSGGPPEAAFRRRRFDGRDIDGG